MQRHASHAVTLEGIRKRFLTVANDDDANYSKFVALLRSGKGMSTGVCVWGPAGEIPHHHLDGMFVHVRTLGMYTACAGLIRVA